MVQFSDKLDGSTIRYSGGRARGTAGVAARVYHVLDYGAVCDGTTDDTAAVLAACAAAEASGGVVRFPRGKCKITQGYAFTAGIDGSNKAVWVEGVGHHNTQILFHPSTLSDNCFTWGDGISYYFGGGTRNIQVRNPPQTCTGAGVHFYMTLHSEMIDSYVMQFAAGTGLKVRGEGLSNVQHLLLQNAYLQQCGTGADIDNSTATVAINLKINQNYTRGLICNNSTLLWQGGVLQGASSGAHSTWQNTGNVTITGVHIEVMTTPVLFELTSCAHFAIDNCGWSNAATPQTLIKATNSHHVQLGHVDVHAPSKLLELVGSTATTRCVADAAYYSIDANSRVDFVGEGYFPSGFGLTSPPTGQTALEVGGPFKLKSYTTAQRNALSSPQVGWVIWNSTVGAMQVYNGSAWV